jgi:hypothetical protein
MMMMMMMMKKKKKKKTLTTVKGLRDGYNREAETGHSLVFVTRRRKRRR